jgi:hypothetical protein
MTAFVVGTLDMRRALQSTLPHVEPDPELIMFHRVRVGVGPVNVTLSATEGHTAAVAIVSVVDNIDGEFGVTFDLSPLDVKEILGLFKVSKACEEMGATLSFVIDKDHVRVTDVSKPVPGQGPGPAPPGRPGHLPRRAADDRPAHERELHRCR